MKSLGSLSLLFLAATAAIYFFWLLVDQAKNLLFYWFSRVTGKKKPGIRRKPKQAALSTRS